MVLELDFCIKPAHRHRKAAHEPNLQSRPGLTEGRFFLLSGICRSGQFFLIICTAGSTGFVIRLQQGFVVDLQAGSTLHYLQRSFRSLLAHRDKKERPNGIELAVHSMQSADIKKREQIQQLYNLIEVCGPKNSRNDNITVGAFFRLLAQKGFPVSASHFLSIKYDETYNLSHQIENLPKPESG